ILGERSGLQRVAVTGVAAGDERAYVLTQLIGPVAAGDRVVLNTTAVELGLGTGGWHVVHWNLSREAWSEPGPGHVMKLRYTSLQVDAGAAEEHGDPGRDLGGMPVVACGLHSQVAAVAAVVKHLAPGARLAYVMTDGAALPLALSDLVHDLRAASLLDLTVSTGQAFGGDLEAVNLHSGLALARRHGADVAVAGVGPGVVGTGTALGHTGLDVTAVVLAARALGGRPVVAGRASDADPRPRHRGLSHHTTTALELARAAAADGVVAAAPEPDESTPDVGRLLAALGVRVTSMGRGPEDDPALFQWAGAAGAAAARMLA
ncbi:MAG TPA: DUF3866 family protein, partial [Acidimicrobiales bacterium]|nr:DUF3866 family protein [Acidimicrobiales bacterium]